MLRMLDSRGPTSDQKTGLRPLSRRAALCGLLSVNAPWGADGSSDLAAWSAFKSRFLAPDGRIVDTGNGGISHSEGQGWGLFLAATFDDREAFRRILHWTNHALRRSADTLHAWRYVPASGKVEDTNNATDGDLFIAAALARAARRWGDRVHAVAAGEIARDILRLLVRSVGPRMLLLPGLTGFESNTAWIVNPSYYAFPFIAELEWTAPSPVWKSLRRDGVALVQAGRFGPRQLPPDWLSVARRGGELSVAPGWPAHFSYDAIRIPLYLAWARLSAPALTEALARFWSGFPDGAFPAWADLVDDATAPYRASPGMLAIARLTLARLAGASEPAWPAIAASPDYYSAVLTLLARTAWRESAVGQANRNI
jgi:endo-1,4-beta-D-glucanase Y